VTSACSGAFDIQMNGEDTIRAPGKQ